MANSKISAAQKKLIDRFSDAKDGKRIIEKYLKETEKKTVEDLTLQEASRLITRIKDNKIQTPSTKTSPTVKQTTLINKPHRNPVPWYFKRKCKYCVSLRNMEHSLCKVTFYCSIPY